MRTCGDNGETKALRFEGKKRSRFSGLHAASSGIWKLEPPVRNDQNGAFQLYRFSHCVTIWCVVLCRAEKYLNPPFSKVSLNPKTRLVLGFIRTLFFFFLGLFCFAFHFSGFQELGGKDSLEPIFSFGLVLEKVTQVGFVLLHGLDKMGLFSFLH